MNYFVYILYSETLDFYYKGFTTNINNRLESHLLGQSNFTSKAKDWEIVYSEIFQNKKDALKEEKRLKKLNRTSLLKIIKKS